MANEIAIWDKVLKAALNVPLVKVDRNKYLSKELLPYMTLEEITVVIEGKTAIPKRIRDKISKGAINHHLTIACSLSAVAGIPGGFAMFGTVPADLAQFYAQILIVTQKLLYLYGWEDLCDRDGVLSDEATHILTVWIGLMFGCEAAIGALNQILKNAAKEALKRIPRIAFGHAAFYVAARHVAKWLGIRLTQKGVAQAAAKAIPLIGAPTSALLTYSAFKPMAKRLKKYLDETA